MSGFSRFAQWVSCHSGRPSTFILAVLTILVWAASGPFFGWSETWQLVINTGTTIVTFLMVFLIQNTQSRDTEAIHLKLDELISADREARNQFLDLEHLSEAEIASLREGFLSLCRQQETRREPAVSPGAR